MKSTSVMLSHGVEADVTNLVRELAMPAAGRRRSVADASSSGRASDPSRVVQSRRARFAGAGPRSSASRTSCRPGARHLADKDLGEMPPADRPSERALWVAALLNPCGADRQAWPVLGIRPAVLTATTPMERALGRQDGDGRQHVQAQGRLMADEHVLLVRWRASAVACPPGKPRRE